VFVYRLTVPIDDFDGLIPLGHWLTDPAPQRTARTGWVLTAVLALTDAADQVGWRGDVRHLPMVGVLSTSYQTTPYLVVEQDDDGATFIITQAEPDWIDQTTSNAHVTARTVGSCEPTPQDRETGTQGQQRHHRHRTALLTRPSCPLPSTVRHPGLGADPQCLRLSRQMFVPGFVAQPRHDPGGSSASHSQLQKPSSARSTASKQRFSSMTASSATASALSPAKILRAAAR